jgi:hypothetical protein
MVTNQMEKSRLADKVSGAIDSMAVSQRLRLVDKVQASSMVAGYLGIGSLISWPHDQTDFLDAGAQDFFQQDAQHRFFHPIAVDEHL